MGRVEGLLVSFILACGITAFYATAIYLYENWKRGETA